MSRTRSPNSDKERSPHHQAQLSRPAVVLGPQQLTTASYATPAESHTQNLPTYSQTILQEPTLAADPSVLTQPSFTPGSPATTSRRQSSSSMRNASMNYETITPTSTPTGRISKAKKGKRVHACEFPGCGKVCVVTKLASSAR